MGKHLSPEQRVNALHLSPHELSELAKLHHYIWWKSEEHTMKRSDFLIAQIMNIGLYEDVCAIADLLGNDRLRFILAHAECGQFEPRSWHYWHYRLTGAKLGEVPPLPKRFPDDEFEPPPEHAAGRAEENMAIACSGLPHGLCSLWRDRHRAAGWPSSVPEF